ncbi:MAG: hypothetical protein PHV99_01140 [Candidatus Pacebacteria bacterium]|nr:hypothetical protein [Candidatus Paceibacterota bacterium]
MKKKEEAIKTAFDKTQKMFPKWPKHLEWGVMENRAPMRAIQYRADLHWDNKEYEQAGNIPCRLARSLAIS